MEMVLIPWLLATGPRFLATCPLATPFLPLRQLLSLLTPDMVL